MTWLNDQRADDFNAKGNRVRRGFGAATFNRYVTALKSFGKWMQREGRASDCPLEGLRKLNAKTDKRHPRRPLDVNELLWLLDTTRNGPDRQHVRENRCRAGENHCRKLTANLTGVMSTASKQYGRIGTFCDP